MSKFNSRLLVLVLLLGLLTIIMSCSQTDDITAPKSMTKVWLRADRLPPAAPGMAYELWASKVAVTDISDPSQVISAGRFSFLSSDTLVSFLEPGKDVSGNDVIRADSNLFVFNKDLFDYEYLFVSVEALNSGTGLPGPSMLIQRIRGNTDTLEMYFPLSDSLFNATVRCNFETPTDGNRGFDGYGLWFSIYQAIEILIVDTNSVTIDYVWDTIYPLIDDQTGDTLNFASLYGPYPDTVWVEFDTVMVDFGQDSLPLGIDSLHFFHNGATQRINYVIDSTQIPRIVKNYDGGIVYDTVVHDIDLDVFTQDLFGLPDLTSYGWHYKGWVVLDQWPAEAIGNFSPPAWDFKTGDLLIPGYEGGLLTTGTFSHITEPDDADPFTLEIEWEVDSGGFIDTVLKRPSFPGEDFIDDAAIAAAFPGIQSSDIYLFGYGPGTIFVTIEPLNMVSDSTNFPLIAFGFQMPSSPANFFYLNSGFWPLLNWTGSAPGTNGFPVVTAELQRL